MTEYYFSESYVCSFYNGTFTYYIDNVTTKGVFLNISNPNNFFVKFYDPTNISNKGLITSDKKVIMAFYNKNTEEELYLSSLATNIMPYPVTAVVSTVTTITEASSLNIGIGDSTMLFSEILQFSMGGIITIYGNLFLDIGVIGQFKSSSSTSGPGMPATKFMFTSPSLKSTDFSSKL